MARSRFNRIFWVGNIIEVLERFAYYGLYMGFSIYVTTAVADNGLGWSKGQLGFVQTLFLLLSYSIPLISGILADRYGFKRMLFMSYLLYLPGFLLLLITRNMVLVTLVMALIGIAAGVFKPLIAGTVRLTTDKTNRTLGFGIFYLMVNVGAFFGPMTAGALRTISWNYAFLASSIAVVSMMAITGLWYRNPMAAQATADRVPLTQTLKEIIPFLKDPKILVFIIIFGLFIEIPFWTFFNLITLFVDSYVRTDILYRVFTDFFTTIGLQEFGELFVGWFSTTDADGVKRIAGETLGHTALYIVIFQMLVTRTTEGMRSVPAIAAGIFIMVLGCVGFYYSTGDHPAIVFLGIMLFAIGEMTSMPRFEQYLIQLLPKEKTGLGGGLLRIPVAVGALSGITMTPLFGYYESLEKPEVTWVFVAGMLVLGFVAVLIYDRIFKPAS